MKKDIKGDNMNNPFKKLFIPEESIEHFLMLYDDFLSAGKGDRLAKYKVWTYLAEKYPEVKSGTWTINLNDVFNPYIYKSSDK